MWRSLLSNWVRMCTSVRTSLNCTMKRGRQVPGLLCVRPLTLALLLFHLGQDVQASCLSVKDLMPLALLSRMRITMTAPKGQLEMTVEVMSILPGVYLVDIAKVTGDSVDFYNSYAKLTELVQPLITADALRRADSGQTLLGSTVLLCWVTDP